MALITFTKNGIYCPRADVYIDPWRKVKNALITHGHSDHSRPGHENYLCTHTAKPAIKYRLGQQIKIQSVAYGENITINGVKISFHPAGHILGSAQIRLEYKGEVWVVSGDYKLDDDGLSEPFEPIKCHTFITESTFGLPVYRWPNQNDVYQQINTWWKNNQEMETTSVLTCYSLGKAQRLLQNVDPSIGPIYTHGAIENINSVIRDQGINLNTTVLLDKDVSKEELKTALVLAPPAAIGTNWLRHFSKISTGIASGWMALRGPRRRRSVDRGFVLSDHADWDGLLTAIKETGCEKVFVTHGYTSIFSKYLNEIGYDASIVETRFHGELAEIGESAT